MPRPPVGEDVIRGERDLLAFIRGEGAAPGFETMSTTPVDPTAARQSEKTPRRR